jgi:tRNA threonylcarbamoyladenosine biosynthesis protein TsaB
MRILAVEFSSARRSVAVLAEWRVLGVARESAPAPAPRATHAVGLASRALSEAGLEREAIECVAVGLGPGSYTGIRAAIAFAQGWQLATGPGGIKLLGISSVACLAAQAQALGWLGRVNFAIDAQRNEFYLAGWVISAGSIKEVQPLALATLEEARKQSVAGGIMAGPEVQRWFAAGRELFPDAAMLAQLAAERTDFVSAEKLEPIYLREPAFVKAPPPRVLPE